MMKNDKTLGRSGFKTKFGVVAAAAGSAVGLGNIWKFPYITGVYGGAAFLIVYLLFIAAIGVPVMLSEFIIGRRAQRNAFGAFKQLAPGSPWKIVGLLGVASAFMILAFYGVVAGWSIEYIYMSISNSFKGLSPDQLGEAFDNFVKDPIRPLGFQMIFMILTGLIVLLGVQKGIERNVKVMMPLLFVLIIVLCVRAVTLEGADEGLKFLFYPDFSKLTGEAVLSALGHAFFSLSLGMGTLITYGSYINKENNLISTSVEVTLADTVIAILAGVAIFPAVFAFGIEPTSGPGLVFITLPNVFQQMPGGYIFSVLFFVLLTIAALTSSISILEVVVAYLEEEFNYKRVKSTIIGTFLISIVGVFCSLSMGVGEEFKLFGLNFFDLLDFIAANIFLPIGGIAIALFVGWYLDKKNVREEIEKGGVISRFFLELFMIIVKVVAPAAIAVVFVLGLFH